MAKKITLDNLSSTIEKILDDYGEEVVTNLSEITKRVGKAGTQALKNTSHETFNGDKYYKGWTYRTEVGRLYTKVTIYNGKLAGLPHLLEHGHAKANGGRVAGRAHIAPVEEKLISEYEREVMTKL